MTKIKVTTLSELVPDDRNANNGTVRGLAALDRSLRTSGAGRSILIDKNGKIIAGNKTTERAADIGLNEVIIVQTDGTKIVAVQRTDLDLDTDPKARELAYADNRVGELDLAWDVEQLLADVESGIDLSYLFNQDDVSALLESVADDLLAGDGSESRVLSNVEFKEYDESVENEVKYCECPNCGHKWPK